MDEAIEVLAEYDLWDVAKIIFYVGSAIALVVVAVSRAVKAVHDSLQRWYNKKKGKEEAKETIEETIEDLSTRLTQVEEKQESNVKMFTEHELGVLQKLDELMDMFYAMKKDNDEVDCTILRDRIMGGMRYFSQNKDVHGKVHISFGDHENMQHMYDKYFAKGGNGSIRKKYDNEFRKFIIDD